MFRSSFILFAISILIGPLNISSSAQEKPAESPASDLAIEIVSGRYPDLFQVSSSDGSYRGISPTPKLPGWKQASDMAPLTGIRIRPVLERDGVRIKIGVVFDDSEPFDAPGPKYGEKEQIIGSYFARLGETVTVSELETLGREALVLRVAKYQPSPVPENVSVPVGLPTIVNELKSIGVVDWRPNTPWNGSGRLIVQNISAKNIVSATLNWSASYIQTLEGTRAKPLARSGATFETTFRIDRSTDARVPLVIKSVLFDDGGFEGDMDAAAEMAARLQGREIQFARLLELLRDTSTAPDQETVKVIQQIRTAVEKFRIDVDPASVKQLESQFPNLGDKEKALLAEKVMDGLKLARSHALYLIDDIERRRSENSNTLDPQQFLTALRERTLKMAGNDSAVRPH